MSTKLQERIKKLYREEKRRVIRSWLFGLGVFCWCLVIMASGNPLASPESWASTYSFFAAIGSFDHYALGFAIIGLFFVILVTALPLNVLG